MKRLDDEPNESMEVIWQNYYSKLVHHARQKLKSLPRRHVDEEDVASDAMNSLFRGMQSGRFPNLNDREDLWKLLLTIAARKAGKEIRSNLTTKRGGGMIRGESVFCKPGDQMAQGLDMHAIALEPTPDFADDFVSEFEQQMGKLEDDVLRNIAVLKLEGYTNEEIGKKLQCATRSVERKLRRIRGIWNPEEN